MTSALTEACAVTLLLSDENFGKLVAGKSKAQNLFMSGKLKVKGNVMKGKELTVWPQLKQVADMSR